MGSIDPSILQKDSIAKLMTPTDRKREGVVTASEAAAKAEAKAERELQSEIANYLRQHDLQFINPPMHKRSMLPKGWGDFTFVYRSVPIILEAKTCVGKLSSDQQKLHPKLRANGWRVMIARGVADVQAVFREIDAKLNPPAAALAELRKEITP
jgi:hypothetical protein